MTTQVSIILFLSTISVSFRRVEFSTSGNKWRKLIILKRIEWIVVGNEGKAKESITITAFLERETKKLNEKLFKSIILMDY